MLTLGASILLYRTLRMMLVEQAFEILLPWVVVLLIAEFLLDLGWFLGSITWFVTNKAAHSRFTLRVATAAIILHGVRVLIYVLGRTGPWVNFDVKPAYRDAYAFEWLWVYLAAILAFLGVAGVVVVWRIIRFRRKQA